MGKKQVRQVRQQIRRVQPKAAPSTASNTRGASRKQRERYIQAGGMLQGYAPEFVLRLGYISIGIAVVCLIAIALLLVFLPPYEGWPVAVVAAVAWVMPIALLASFVAPGFRLALKDRKAENRLVQGQLVGASSVSQSIGLGMLMVQTRGGQEQYLVAPARLKQVPGNQVNVVLTVSPNLRHVRSVGVMGQRLAPRVEPPPPAAMKWLQRLPIITPASLALSAVIGADVIALIPMTPVILHAGLALVVAVALTGGVYAGSTLLQRRYMKEIQAIAERA